ncbi:GntR family transcriptional regulator [Neorhizobium sp. JUb45]|uniref:GntR family transcriptional regulator n=1 Tax=unclassified Neorhizobium TaxID=2629175 RepID=UPI00104D1DF3
MNDEFSWTPQLDTWEAPIYLAIANALAQDIPNGRLAEGRRFPTQRKLANKLGIDFTTVSRPYSGALQDPADRVDFRVKTFGRERDPIPSHCQMGDGFPTCNHRLQRGLANA